MPPVITSAVASPLEVSTTRSTTIPSAHNTREPGVGDGIEVLHEHGAGIALVLTGGERRTSVRDQFHRAAGEGAHPDAGTLDVLEHRHGTAVPLGGSPDPFDQAAVAVVVAVAEVEAGDIEAGRHHLVDHFGGTAGRSQGGDDLGLARHRRSRYRWCRRFLGCADAGGRPPPRLRDAKTRLGSLDAGRRQALAQAVATHVITTCRAAGFEVLVVTGAPEVSAWCEALAIPVVADPGHGLDGAAEAGIAAAGSACGRWCTATCPCSPPPTSPMLPGVPELGPRCLAPSRDGGTNLIASTGGFPFRYGPGSFARHLGAAPDRSPQVMVTVGLAVEIDTPADLAAASAHARGGWMRGFLS